MLTVGCLDRQVFFLSILLNKTPYRMKLGVKLGKICIYFLLKKFDQKHTAVRYAVPF